MSKVSLVPKKNQKDESQADWYQIMEVDDPDLELSYAERELFNYSFDSYTKESYRDAYRGFKELSELGSSVSQYFLGVMFLKGCGVLQDFEQAHVWFNIASSKGHGKARTHLEKLTKKMSADQIAEAQMEAKEWVESKEDDVSHSIID